MKLRSGEKILVAIVIVSFAISVGSHWNLPERIALGWGGNDWRPIRYGSKLFGTFLISILMSALFLPYFLFTRLKRRVDDERYTYYDQLFVWLFALYLFFQLYIVFWNFGYRIQLRIERFLLPLMGLLFFALGDAFAHAKQGWFISWRNRWTQRDKDIWKKTHEGGGRWLKLAGVAGLLGLVLPFQYAGYPTAVFAYIAVLYVLIYPFVACLKLKHTDEEKGNV